MQHNTSNRIPKVIVSNPNRMHTHQLCVGLDRSGSLDTFYTTIWYNPDVTVLKTLCCIPVIGKKVRHAMLKRYEEQIPAGKVKTYPWYEMIRQIKRKIPFLTSSADWFLYVSRQHDLYVSKQIRGKNYDVFIGYEGACLNSLKIAKQEGKTTVLDLTQVHWKYLQLLRDQYPVFRAKQEEWLFKKISAVKNAEYDYVDHIFVLSSLMKESLIDNGIKEGKIHMVNLGFDPTKFECKRTYDNTADRPLKLLFVGAITKGKGIHLLLEMVKQLTNTQLTLIGTIADDAINCLKQYKECYTHIPFLHHHELAQKYQEADLFVLPSYLDSWAMVVLEAMASGTPVIVTENTGSKDVVSKGGGKVIPVDDLDALKLAIEYYESDRFRLEEDGIKAYQIAQNYTWNNYYDQINKVISAIVG